MGPHRKARQPYFYPPGLRLLCQTVAFQHWDVQYVDLKIFRSFKGKLIRQIQRPPEAGKPRYMAARPKNPAYGVSEDLRKWWNRLDAAMHGSLPCKSR